MWLRHLAVLALLFGTPLAAATPADSVVGAAKSEAESAGVPVVVPCLTVDVEVTSVLAVERRHVNETVPAGCDHPALRFNYTASNQMLRAAGELTLTTKRESDGSGGEGGGRKDFIRFPNFNMVRSTPRSTTAGPAGIEERGLSPEEEANRTYGLYANFRVAWDFSGCDAPTGRAVVAVDAASLADANATEVRPDTAAWRDLCLLAHQPGNEVAFAAQFLAALLSQAPPVGGIDLPALVRGLETVAAAQPSVDSPPAPALPSAGLAAPRGPGAPSVSAEKEPTQGVVGEVDTRAATTPAGGAAAIGSRALVCAVEECVRAGADAAVGVPAARGPAARARGEDAPASASAVTGIHAASAAPAGEAVPGRPEAGTGESERRTDPEAPLDRTARVQGLLLPAQSLSRVDAGIAIGVSVAFGLVALLAVALYQRIAKPAALDHPQRAALYAACAKRSVTAGEAAQIVGLTRKTAEYHLLYLARLGLLREERTAVGVRRFAQSAVAKAPREEPLGDRILECLRVDSGRDTSDLAGALGVTRTRIDRAAKVLLLAGVVTSRIEKGARRFYLG